MCTQSTVNCSPAAFAALTNCERNPARYASTQAHGQGYDAKNLMHTIRLLETALKADGARYHIDCSAGASGDYHCLFLNAAQGKIRRTNVAGLPGQTFYIPGNGAIYSDTDDSNSRYYRVRQKWTLHNGEIQENEQPYHYLGLASQYRGILKADSDAHDLYGRVY